MSSYIDDATLNQLHFHINSKYAGDVDNEYYMLTKDEVKNAFTNSNIYINIRHDPTRKYSLAFNNPMETDDDGSIWLVNNDIWSYSVRRLYPGNPYNYKIYYNSNTQFENYTKGHYRVPEKALKVQDVHITYYGVDNQFCTLWYKVALPWCELKLYDEYVTDYLPADMDWVYDDNGHQTNNYWYSPWTGSLWIPSATINASSTNNDGSLGCDGLIKQFVEPFVEYSTVPDAINTTTDSNEDITGGGNAPVSETKHSDSGTPEVLAPEPEQAAIDNYSKNFSDLFYETEKGYFSELYSWKKDMYSAKSFDSIIGMPVQFMNNVDMRFGTSTFGKQFTEDILYDAPIAIIHPGAPALNASAFDVEDLGDNGLKGVINAAMKAYAYAGAFINGEGETAVKNILLNILSGENTRFYGFQNEYNRYIQYVNTLCHLFASFLGISNLTNPRTGKLYREYDDTIEEVEKIDSGLGLKLLYGNYPAMFVYYQPDSSISHTVTNQTQESSLVSKLNEVSNFSKEMSFFAGGLGIASGKGVTVGADADNNSLFNLSSTSFAFGNNLISRIFSRTAEGVGTIIAGNNLSLPEIYSNSDMSGSEYTLNIKLVNPYGTPEGAFLFQLRHLARLMAVSFPRQFGPNGYTAPFIIRAFSKGNFNIQLGIVESLTIRRAGSGGENQTVHDIPMELDVSITIKDLYRQVALTNEYTDGVIDLVNTQQLQLLFNNTGLLDFVASYAGYNMNSPNIDTAIDLVFDYMANAISNNFKDIVDFNGTINIKEWKFARWDRMINDAFRNAVASRTSFMT